MNLSRRSFLHATAFGLSTGPFLTLATALARTEESLAEAQARSHKAHGALTEREGLKMQGDEIIAMLLYPGFTALDLVGPQYMFGNMMGAKVHLVTKGPSTEPVKSDTGLAIQPTMTFADVPEKVTVLFVPGSGAGVVNAMQDKETVAFVKSRGESADYVTSVCTGSLLLGMAGLLHNKRATSHWVTRSILTEFGALPVDARVVTDGKVITGAGVTAGLDFGLAIIAALRGKEYARAVQLQAEYAPEPPFEAGTPGAAGPFLTKTLSDLFAPVVVQAREAAQAANRSDS